MYLSRIKSFVVRGTKDFLLFWIVKGGALA